MTLRLAVGAIESGNADAFAARDQQLGQREGDDQRPLELDLARGLGGEAPSRASDRARSTPCARLPIRARAHRDGRHARRAPPVDVLRRLAGRRSGGIAGEIFAGTGAAPSVQAVDDVGGDTAGFEHQARQRSGERTAFAIGTSDRDDLLRCVPVVCGHQPIRAFNCLITSGIVRPSARAWNVSAMRCFNMGSARSSTSSTRAQGVRRSARVRARRASRIGLARGPGPQAMNLPVSPLSSPGRAERTSDRIVSTTESPTGETGGSAAAR